MSNNLKKILVVGVSLLMFASVGTGVSNIYTNVHAMSQAKLRRIYLPKTHTNKVTKRFNNYKLHKIMKSYRNRSQKIGRRNNHSLRKTTTYHNYRSKGGKLAKSNASHQYKQGFNVSKSFDFPPSTYRGFKLLDDKYYNGLHHPMTKAYKRGFLRGAEQAGRTAAFEGAGFDAYRPKFRRRAFKYAHKATINSLVAWKYSLNHNHNYNFNIGEKAELGLVGNGYSIPKSLRHLSHNHNFKNGWIASYDYTLGISLKSHHLNNSSYDGYINN